MSTSCSSDDSGIIAAMCLYHEQNLKRKRKRGAYWSHDIFRARLLEGEFHTLFKRLQEDERKFYKYFKMTPEKFNHIV